MLDCGTVGRVWRRVAPWLVMVVATTISADASPRKVAGALPPISVSPSFFNPSLGQKITVATTLARDDEVSISIIDPEGFVVRTLLSSAWTRAGQASWTWDGRDDAGEIVADEAYSLKMDFRSAGSYFPARLPQADVPVVRADYDPHRGIIRYDLPRAARVRVSVSEGAGRVPSHVIVDWQPRTAGSVLEPWNGYDASGGVRLLSRPDSRITIEAKPLCENVLITVGNRTASYEQRQVSRTGVSLLTGRSAQ